MVLSGLYAASNGSLLTVGGQATLTCKKNGANEAVVWWRDDRQIQNDTVKYLIQTRDVNSTLTIYTTGIHTCSLCVQVHKSASDVIPACLYYRITSSLSPVRLSCLHELCHCFLRFYAYIIFVFVYQVTK